MRLKKPRFSIERSSRSFARALQRVLRRVSVSVLQRKMVRNRSRIRGSLCSSRFTAGWYFPGRQDFKTKWVKCASIMQNRQNRELQAEGGWESFFFLQRVSTVRNHFSMGGVHALCHGQRPSIVVDSVRVYDIKESVLMS